MAHLVQVNVDVVKAARHLQTFFSRDQMADDSLVLKSMLTEAFGGPVIRPWAVHAVRDAKVVIVGYAEIPADAANERRSLALPSVQASVDLAVSAPLPDLREGQTFRFAVRLVPTIRVTKKEAGPRYGERDAFLAEVDRVGTETGVIRDVVYQRYLVERLSGAEVVDCRLSGFRLLRFTRPRADGKWAPKMMPEAVLEGTLKVNDGALLSAAILRGIGRQRAYGFGMLRLQPERTFTAN